MPVNEGYKAFIREAFIKPIRSVLIVDDDYPTYSEMLDLQQRSIAGQAAPASAKRWRTNPEQIQKVIDSFRRPELSLVVDIHDGGDGTEASIAYHLHQSDLLVLDFQLGDTAAGASKSVEIARKVMANDHFNLVVVHTAEDLQKAFREILLGVMAPCCDGGTAVQRAAAQQLIEKHELEQDDGIVGKIEKAFEIEQYLFARQDIANAMRAAVVGNAPFAGFSDVCKQAGWKPASAKQIFAWAMHRFESKNHKKMHFAGNKLQLKWSEQDRWIRSHSGFFAFAKKTEADLDILHELWQSLIAWGPEPSRLFLTKLRSALEETGVAAEDATLRNRFLLARWYADLLAGDEIRRKTLIDISISRHAEQMLDHIQASVQKFAEQLVAEDAKGPVKDTQLVHAHFAVDLGKASDEKQAERDHNIFACSKKPSGWHLQTGHVFVASESHWVCLSPACDLVPGQKTSGHYKEVSTRIPFFAVKLQPVSDTQVIDVHSNRFIFLELREGKRTFCISDPARMNSAPQWYPLYAANFGKFEQDFKFKFSRLSMDGGELVAAIHEAQVVAQLRYEYALNLVQTLGSTFTRIGLDFVGKSVAWTTG
ncbi:response regulator receiver domain [Bradyrhizobium sp. 482_C4_N1_1]|uniref:response regulator receiver domain n=1 Tax=unclassified Bradyrhizobium TaxID=2631580 RepID=UPI003F88A51C